MCSPDSAACEAALLRAEFLTNSSHTCLPEGS